MKYGTEWYPEQWPESRWKTELELMRSIGMNVMRTGVYGWTQMEPREGEFRFDWLHRAVDLAATYGVEVVLTTPSDAPPAWMTQKYPEVLRVKSDGQATRHGARRHFSPVSAKYREFCRIMAEKMAEQFGRDPNVIGWQIGNEFCEWSYDEETRRAFQRWLRGRYASLDELNARWGLTSWAQEYSDWSQVQLPVGWASPCLSLECFRFMSEMFADFQRVQIDAIHRHAEARQWTTHNIHAWEDLDFTKIIADCDVAGWDPYPGINRIDYPRFGWTSDFSRTLKSRPHWIMEMQPGHVNWSAPNAEMPRGSIRAMMWHFLGHGAEALLYWQWRMGLGAHEQYHGTLLGPDGRPRPIFDEAKTMGHEIERTQELLTGLRTEAAAAVIYTYADQFALSRQPHNPAFEGKKHMLEYYAPLRRMAIDVDVIHPENTVVDWSNYRLLVAPHLHCLDDATAQRLADYVQAGGHLLLGPRTGFKDELNALSTHRQPGKVLGELLGASVEDFESLDCPAPVGGELGGGLGNSQAIIWAEYLQTTAPDAQVLLRYGKFNGWIDGKPAMVTRMVGKGRITYLGAWLEETAMRRVMEWAVKISGVPRHFPEPPENIEVCRRVRDGREVFIVINHADAPAHLDLPRELTNQLAGNAKPARQVNLTGYDVQILA